jgi:hypothetical protein
MPMRRALGRADSPRCYGIRGDSLDARGKVEVPELSLIFHVKGPWGNPRSHRVVEMNDEPIEHIQVKHVTIKKGEPPILHTEHGDFLVYPGRIWIPK